MFCQPQDLAVVLLGQVGPEQEQAGQVKLAGSDLLEHDRELPCELRGARGAERRILGHPKLVHAVSTEAGAGPHAVNAASFDLGEVRKQAGELLVRTRDEASRAGEQGGVREMLDGVE